MTACRGETIPKQVMAGSTFVAPLNVGSLLGYGAQLGSQGTDGLLTSDSQRGNVRFVLCPNTACSPARPLLTRYLTRVFPDPGSRAGLSGDLSLVGSAQSGIITGQPLGIFDVPLNTPAGMYTLRYLRSGGEQGDVSTDVQQLRVVPGTSEQFTDLTTELALQLDVSDSLRDLVPLPQLVLELINKASDRPAAAVLTLRHPARIRVEGAFEHGSLGQGSIVGVSPGPQPNTVSLTLIDPKRKTFALALAFSLNAGAQPVTSADFAIESQRLYDANGVALPLANAKNDPGNRFVFPAPDFAIR